MARLDPHQLSADVTAPPNGTGASDARLTDRYCARCGGPVGVGEAAITRFGEAFCSDAHAQEFVEAVRATRVQAAAGAQTAIERAAAPADVPAERRDWKAYLGKALCWGAPLLIVAVLLAGGAGALTGVAGAALPFLAALACPLGMYFMMRSMSKMGGHGDSKDNGRDR
jgi:Protein of unknown function (DUF2933)